MGCCQATAKTPASTARLPLKQVAVTCSVSADSVVFNTANISAIREGLRKRFPALVFKSFRLMFAQKELASAEDIRREADKLGGKLAVQVEVEAPVRLDAEWENVTGQVFILAQGDSVIGTGFMLTPELSVCTADNFEVALRKGELISVFPEESNQRAPLAKDGLCEVLSRRGTLQTCLVQLQQPKTATAPVQISSEIPSDTARVLFFTRQRPVLQSEVISPLTKKGDSYVSEKTLREGANGAPVFNSKRELIGVYANVPEETTGILLPVATFREKLQKAMPSLGDKIMDAFSGFFAEAKAVVDGMRPADSPKDTVNKADEGKADEAKGKAGEVKGKVGEVKGKVDEVKGKVDEMKGKVDPEAQSCRPNIEAPPPQPGEDLHADPPVAPAQVLIEVQSPGTAQSPRWEAPDYTFADPFFSISLKENSITQFSSQGEVIRSHRFEAFLASGYSAVFTPKGLVVTVCDSEVKMWSFLLSDSLQTLRKPLWLHQFQCGVWFQGRVFQISGLNSESVEAYTFAERYWAQLANLPKPRANSTAVAHGNSVYVFGGMGRNLKRYKKSVFVYKDDVWNKLPSLPLRLRNCGALVLNEAILVFGGVKKAKDDQTSDSSLLEVDLLTGSVRETGKQDLGLFGGFSAAEVSGLLVAVSDDGRVYEFQRDLRKFRLVHQAAN